MAFRYFRDDVYFIVTLKKVTEENVTAIKLLDRLVTAQGLLQQAINRHCVRCWPVC